MRQNNQKFVLLNVTSDKKFGQQFPVPEMRAGPKKNFGASKKIRVTGPNGIMVAPK